MQPKLLLVEGIPGSGKTTLSRRMRDYLLSKGVETRLYAEGDLSPADLAWHACIPPPSFEKLLAAYPQERDKIMRQTAFEGETAVVAYTQCGFDDPAAYKAFERYEVCDGRLPLADFGRLHRARWARFASRAKKRGGVTIFECAFFQNHLNELIAYHDADQNEIDGYMRALLDTVAALDPVILYLTQPDVGKTIARVGASRLNEAGEKEWLSRVVDYIEGSPFGKSHNLQGVGGCVAFFERRKSEELRLMKTLSARSFTVDNPSDDWEAVFVSIRALLNNLYGLSDR